MAQGIDVVVCGAALGVAASGIQVPCTLSDGSAGVQQVAHLTLVGGGATSDAPISGGVGAGLEVGGAVFLALAVAFGFRSLRRFLESASES
ncbi:major capsid protein [Burkholderia pseudomallei]|uniref:major capsid protein n=1 Tax=Burkholderia pseudomallei TaxID=28450 RepID=UPI0024E02887|nr:major capsid protein [Burkholderia pseudomallei]